MRRFMVTVTAVLGLVALAVPAVAQRSTSDSGGVEASTNPVPAQYIVTLRTSPGASASAASALSTRHGGHVVRTYSKALAGYTARMTAEQAAELSQDPTVASVEQDGYVTATATQSPSPSWGLDRIDQRDLPLDNSYSSTAAGANVTAYIIDTGIRPTVLDFGGRASIGFDSVGDGQNGVDCNGHGTHVAGTIGGTTYGVAKSVSLVAVRVLGCDGSGTWSGVIAGIDWVTAHRTQNAVANMSLGGGASSAVDTALANSVASGVTYAVAAGNSNTDACTQSPARAPSALTVGSTTSTDARSSFSNYGTCVDLFAPGSGITSDWNTSDTATNTISGTSMASPHVAGSAALYLSDHLGSSPATVGAALLGAATPNKVTSAGAGSPNLLDFVGATTPPVTTTTSTTTTSTTTTSTTTTTVPKQVPAAPVLKGTSVKRAVKLSWTAPNNGGMPIDSYRLTRAASPSGPFSLLASPTATAITYTDNVASRTTSSYCLEAHNSVGWSPVSNTVTITAK